MRCYGLYLISLFFLLTTNCTHTKIDRKSYIDESMLPYIEKYEKDFDAEIVGIPFDFDLLDYDEKEDRQTVGICRHFETIRGRRSIWIHEPSWKKYNKYKRKWLVYHEIAHCYENLEHRESKLVDGCPSSIVDPNIPRTKCIKKHWEYYKDELLYKYNEIIHKKLYMDKTGGRIE